jgi:hypothetical protein
VHRELGNIIDIKIPFLKPFAFHFKGEWQWTTLLQADGVSDKNYYFKAIAS